VLSEKYQLNSKWKKNKLRGAVPVAQAARQTLQMDIVLFGKVFAFTAVDIYTRESDVLLQPGLEAIDGKAFLEHCIPRRFDGFKKSYKPMVAASSRAHSVKLFVTIVIAIALLDLTRRMSKAILKVSTVAYERSVWGGVNTNLQISLSSPFKWKSGCGIIITNAPIFLWECDRRSRSRCDILKCTMRQI